MITKLSDKDFLLRSDLGKALFYDSAADLPIVDYHNHLHPPNLSGNSAFENLAEAWVLHDPYKHRAMRICGVPEAGITGEAGDEEKFMNWARTLPKLIGNPLHLWSAMELSSIFGVQEPLNEQNAMEIWKHCNGILDQRGFGAVDILKKFGVEILCTSDELLADLSDHVAATRDHGIRIFPSLRGDSMLAFEQPTHREWMKELSLRTGIKIGNLDDYQSALIEGIKQFEQAGCRLADHSLDAGFPFRDAVEADAQKVFEEYAGGKLPAEPALALLKNHLLDFLGKEYAKRNWVLQLHIGAQRQTSSRLRKLAGAAGGYSTMGVSCDIGGLVRFFDRMESEGLLPRIILYTLNPADYEAFATLTGSFAEDNVPGKIQFGPAWWYNDHYHGNRSQLKHLASHGVLSQFIGMTTDSRSVLSFSRHEYFRRMLCEQLGEWVQAGIVPDNPELLSRLVKNVSYFNAKKWIFNE